jgi:hypothetical protein
MFGSVHLAFYVFLIILMEFVGFYFEFFFGCLELVGLGWRNEERRRGFGC